MSAFTSFGGFASHLLGIALGIERNHQTHLMAAGRIVQKEAQGAIGMYKYGWLRLSDKTIARKKMGDTPLLETGAMRAGIKVQSISQHEVDVAATDPKSAWHELGTSRIPPRPFMGPAAENTKREQQAEIEKGLVTGLNVGF